MRVDECEGGGLPGASPAARPEVMYLGAARLVGLGGRLRVLLVGLALRYGLPASILLPLAPLGTRLGSVCASRLDVGSDRGQGADYLALERAVQVG